MVCPSQGTRTVLTGATEPPTQSRRNYPGSTPPPLICNQPALSRTPGPSRKLIFDSLCPSLHCLLFSFGILCPPLPCLLGCLRHVQNSRQPGCHGTDQMLSSKHISLSRQPEIQNHGHVMGAPHTQKRLARMRRLCCKQ